MKKINATLIILILAFTTIGIVSIIYSTIMTIGVKDINMEIKVSDKIGIAVESEKLMFGGVFPGGNAAKKVVLGNEHKFPITVSFIPLGEIKEYITVSENPVLLAIGETKEISVVASVPSGTPYGNYTGIMRVVFTKVRE